MIADTGRKANDLKTALDGRFAKLIDRHVLSPAYATRGMDGRLVPFALVRVLNTQRLPLAGLVLELHDAEGNVIDAMHSSLGGLAVLKFPARPPREPLKPDQPARVTVLAGGGDVTGSVRLLDGAKALDRRDVLISPDNQVAAVEFILEQPYAPLPVQLPPGDDPLDHLPIDFSEQACAALLAARTDGLLDPNNLTTSHGDPLLSPPAGTKTIAGKRVPLLRRLDVIRWGPDGNRYLVRLRQEWVLLTYTLGELTDVLALDPGAVVQSAEQLASQVASVARQTIDTAKSTVSQTLQDSVSNLGSIDSVVKTVQNTSAHAGGSGWYIGIPGIVGYGDAGVDAGAHLDLSVDTNVNTSLLVNRVVQQVSTLVNEAMSTLQSLTKGAQQATTNVVNHLAPLVSEVANALHWRVYEVYAVCTNVDAVYPIDAIELFPGALTPFTADQVLAFRPFFEPTLLDKTLVSAFNDLLQAAELPPITQATAQITYDARFSILGFPINANATITLTLNGAPPFPVTAPSGTGATVTAQVNFPAPQTRGVPVAAIVSIAGPSIPGVSSTLRLLRVQVWIDQPLGSPGFIVDNPAGGTAMNFSVPVAAGPAGAGVLVTHINGNLHYYYGVLAAAAIFFPSLRADVPALAALDSRLWRLPLVGMEGTVALLIDPTASTVDVKTLLDDPGAGTLVQILAPGAYGEILTGLLQIPLNDLHPLLTHAETISPFGPFPNLTAAVPTSATSGGLPVP